MNLLIALLAVAACASAQKEEDPSKFKHPLTDMPRSAEDVETSPYFPQHPDHKLPVGETITTLCHFSNEGSSYYNVTAVMGSLNSPFEFRHHFQNYSYKTFGTLVKAGEEMSFKYTFQLHPDLEPVDYQLAVTVFYESDKQSFSTTFFNQVRGEEAV
jgi:translocon-associated protein subunit alpha